MSATIEVSAADLKRAESDFLRAYPSYASTRLLDELRATDYARLDANGDVYLDYTGGSQYSASQVTRHAETLSEGVFGNPHSNNPTSMAMTERVERARAFVLDYFQASPDEYYAVFTPNATGALKHAGESYPFAPGGRYLLPFDNHNSVNGIREFARSRGASVTYVPVVPPDLRIDRAVLDAELKQGKPGECNLFAFPAQSNFSGVQHPLELIDEAHNRGWDVLLDAAAFVPTNRLDLSRWKPELVALSFYKIFGYPTGVGCLLLHRSIFPKLHRPWFAGGTIQIASVQACAFHRAKDAAAYEDGTVDYLSIPAVEIGLRHVASIGIDVIHERVHCLTGWLLGRMRELRHGNGRALIEIHGPRRLEGRGGTIAFNMTGSDGESLDIRRVEELANQSRISLRTGCFCNPGTGEVVYGFTRDEIGVYFVDEAGMSFDELRARVLREHGKEVGAIRISVGVATNFADVYRFVRFLEGFLDRTAADVGRVDRASAALMRDTA